MKTRFSVLMPAYNREQYVRQAVDSVLSQAFPHYELLAIDDGSNDSTLQILQSYGTRIKVLQQANHGPEVARNKAAALAQGEYLVMLDSDDILLPCALSTYDQVIQAFDGPPLIIGAMADFQDGQSVTAVSRAALPVKVLKYRDYLSKDVRLPLSSSRIVVRKSVFDEVGGLRNTTAATFHLDSLNFILKVATQQPCVVVQQPYTVAYRHHAANAIRSLDPITEGILELVRTERRGQYPGGSERRQERYACIGSVALSWAIGHCWRAGRWRLGLQLLRETMPMGWAAIAKKIKARFRRPTQAIVVAQR